MTTTTCLDIGDCWSEDGDVLYLSKEHFTRGKAKQAFAEETGVWFPDVRCRTVFMRMSRREDYGGYDSDNPWPFPSDYDEWWVEVPKNDFFGFEVKDYECWRVESK